MRTAIASVLLAAATVGWCDDLLVCSELSDQILRYDGSSGAYLGVFADTHIDGPQTIEVGPDGNVYVGSEYSGNVTKWSPTGAYMGDFVTGLPGPQQMQFGPDGNLYVLNHLSSDPAPVYKFNGTSGAFMGLVGPGAGPGHTHGMAFRGDGHLFIDNIGAGAIHHTGPLGVGDLGVFAGGPELAVAAHMEFGPDGNLYVSNPMSGGTPTGGIIRYNGLSGAPMGVFSTVGVSTGTWGMAFHGTDLFYSAGSGVAKVSATTGGLASAFVSPGSGGLAGAAGIAFLPAVPEPATLAVFGLGLAALRSIRRRTK